MKKFVCKSTATPLPLRKVFVVLVIQFSQVFGSVVLFPFLAFMVQDFFPELSKEELGQKAGYLGSAYFFGSFAGSMMWGWISDVWGRRPALLSGCLGTMCASLLFGLSENFATAVSARFLWGFLNGNVGVVKTYLSEILDDSNQAKGFSVYGLASGTGRLIGSAVGGFLAQPASKYSMFQNKFFCKYRYFLPILVNVGIALVGFISAIIFMEETLGNNSESTSPSFRNGNSSDIDNKSVDTNIEMVTLNGESDDDLQDPDVEEHVFSDTDTLVQESGTTNTQTLNRAEYLKHKLVHTDYLHPFKLFYRTQKEQLLLCCSCFLRNPSTTRSLKHYMSPKFVFKTITGRLVLMVKLMLDRRVAVSVLTYAFVGGVTVMSNETLPLLLITDHEHGGYNMDDNEIAMFIMITGIIMLFYQLFVYPSLVKLTGYRHLTRIALVLFAASSLLFPWSNRITGPIDELPLNITGSASGSGAAIDLGYCGYSTSNESVNQNSIQRIPVLVWIVLLLSIVPMLIGRSACVVTVIVLVNNSTLKTTRGTVNGLGQTLVAVFRSFGPTVGALLFAWSEDNGLNWPLNYHLTFELCAILSIGIIIFTLCLPKSIEKKRTS